MRNDWNLHGKTALITGGTHGIGLASAIEFKALGANVIVVARNAISNFTFELIQADLSQAEDRSRVADKIPKLDILVNNVGFNISKPTTTFSSDEINSLLHLNFIAPLEMTRLLYPVLKTSGAASVINIASIAGSFDVGTGSIYASAKAALIQLTKSLAVEYSADQIRVNSVSPWYTETRRTQSVLSDKLKKQDILDATPLQRIATASDIASVIAFLAMTKSAYITGQDIKVDGGYSAKR